MHRIFNVQRKEETKNLVLVLAAVPNVEVSFRRMKCHTGVLSSFYNGLHRKTPPERGIFFRLQVSMKEKGFHQLKFMKG